MHVIFLPLKGRLYFKPQPIKVRIAVIRGVYTVIDGVVDMNMLGSVSS